MILRKEGLIIIYLIILFSLVYALDDAGTPTESSNDIIEYDTLEETEGFTPATKEEPAIWDISEPSNSDYVQVNNIEETTIKTVDGSIADFNMVNSLFYLGSLIQGSFISFENNNNILFGSLFDSSKFTATKLF